MPKGFSHDPRDSSFAFEQLLQKQVMEDGHHSQKECPMSIWRFPKMGISQIIEHISIETHGLGVPPPPF